MWRTLGLQLNVQEVVMFDEGAYSGLLGDLREVVAASPKYKPGARESDERVAVRDQVIARYKPIFSVDHIPHLSKDEFTSFLYLENNRHWSGLYRTGLHAAEDMSELKHALAILVDESQPIRMRFNRALAKVVGLGKAIATSILTVAYPDKYGVWNSTSEAALRHYGLWPTSEHGEGVGGRYEKVNALLTRLRVDLGVDFWTLDTMWWSLPGPRISNDSARTSKPGAEKLGADVKNTRWEDTPLTFFSYSRQDSSFVLRLAKDLKSSGAPVWLDQLDIKPGQLWDKSTERALAAASRVLVVLSVASIESENVMDEVAFALDEKKTVIPIVYEECRIPFRLRRLQHIDFHLEYEAGLRKLLEALHAA